MEEISEQRFLIPAQTKSFIQQQTDPTTLEANKEYWIRHFIEFIRQHVIKELPDEAYWNSLVSAKMRLLKHEWKTINEILNWTVDNSNYDKYFIELVFLLVHYLDSRFYNKRRIELVKSGIEAAKRSGLIYEEAIFRIDALGWTYMEEYKLEEAKHEIEIGLALAHQLKSTDTKRADQLLALGYAWLGKVNMENGLIQESSQAIATAFTFEAKPWIKYRVHMAAGDIHVQRKDFHKALEHYQSAMDEYDKYGGEGLGYQIGPRIGLAYLYNNQIDNAEKILRLQINEDIPIGKLYAEYGLAILAYNQSNKEEAIRKLNTIEEEIKDYSSSSFLLKLIKNFREKEFIEIVSQFNN